MKEPSSEPAKAERPAKTRLTLWLKRVGVALAVLLVAAVVTGVLVLEHFEEDLPSTAELKTYDPPQVTRVLARDGTLLGEVFVERRTVVRIADVPTQMKLAVLAAEDASFYEHAGLNYLGMVRALLVNLRSSTARQGGSTITQQVIKNVLLTPERSYVRKIREALLAKRIEQELTKDEILELYLNHIYFGHARYGVEEASRYYFGKSVRDVTLAEAALLAGVVKGPGLYSPRIDLERATDRRRYVLDQMVAKGFATPAQAEPAKREPVVLAPEQDALSQLAPEVVDEAKRTLRAAVGAAAERGGYVVTTTIDPVMQVAARGAVRRNLDDLAKRHKLLGPLAVAKRNEPAAFQGAPTGSGHRVFQGVVTGADDARGTLAIDVGTVHGVVEMRDAARYNPKGLLPSQFAPPGKVVRVSLREPLPDPAERGEGGAEPARGETNEPVAEAPPAPPVKLRLELGPEGALVAVDVRTREVLALVGSYESARGGLDRTRAAHRQPGSTFKPFVYSYALHARLMTPASILETSPASMHGYKPGNYDESEGQSPSRLREALAHSVNVAAVWTLDRVGAANVVEWTHALGIESKLGADLSLALGAYEVTPREMASAYATFAAGGVYEAPILVTRIVGPNGAAVPLPARAPARRVMDEPEAYLVTDLLQSVVDHGTATRARKLGRPVAGKTGTSNQAKDAWFVGYTPDVVCAVWTGYDDAVPLGAGEAGATAALPAFVDFMKQAHAGRPVADFPVPLAGLTRVKIDPATGLLAAPDQADAIEEIFLAGSEPTEVAPVDAGAPEDAGPAADAGESAPPGEDAGAPSGPADAGAEEQPGLAPAPKETAPPPF